MDLDKLDIEALRQRRGEKWGIYPRDVLPAWVADMDYPVCPPIQRMLEHSVRIGDIGYPIEQTVDDLPAVFARRAQQRFGWEVKPERVELLTDVVQGLYIALATLSDPGDSAVVQTPVYPPFLQAVPECGRQMLVNPLCTGAAGYEIDFDALRAGIDARTRLILFCHPQNPTGRVFARRELEALAQIALEHDLVVCSDEIHSDLVYPGARHIPFATLSPEVEARTITLTSATKAFNIAGLRCAVAAFGSDALQQRFNSLPRHARGGLGSLGLSATSLAWSEGQPWLDEVLAYLEGNRRFVAEFVDERLPGIRHRAPQATYLAWLDCRDLALQPDPYRFFLQEARVALSNGRAFGPGSEGFVRLNFATSRPILTQILERMAAALARRAASQKS